MIESRRRVAVVFAAVLVLASACSSGDDTDEFDPESMIGSVAPALQGTDLTGAGVTDLADLAGKPTAVYFWLNTCPHCQDGIVDLQAAWPEMADRFNILTVGMQHPDLAGDPGFETVSAFVASTGLTLPTIESTWAQAQTGWSLNQVPMVYILDADQMIIGVVSGGTVVRVRDALEAEEARCCLVP
ncbi:MAG TPA: TlpA disulfide reductase family protein [Acidimicrobiia bacterium]|nr:TlpA disulfide reductase family protein [Acidimicrobiia bacterium]